MLDRSERVSVAPFAVEMALILAVLVAGCEGDLRSTLMQRDLDSLRSEVAAISRRNEGEGVFVEDRIGKLETELKSRLEKAAQERSNDAEGFMGSQASLNTKLDELADQARLTQGRVEEIGHRISELNKRVDGLGNQLSQALVAVREATMAGQTSTAAAQDATALAQQAATASTQTAQHVTNALQQMADQANAAIQQVNATTQLALSEARKAVAAKQTAPPVAQQAPGLVKLPSPPSTLPSSQATPSPPPPALPARPAGSAVTPDELYKNALNDYTKGKYDLAIDGFRAYIIQYPNTSLLPNAEYWLGESFYSQKNYGLAIKQFDLFLTDYPDSPKVPGALLKQGYAHLELRETSRGRTVLTTVIKRFPKSPEAKSAKARLSQLKKGPGRKPGAKGPSKRVS